MKRIGILLAIVIGWAFVLPVLAQQDILMAPVPHGIRERIKPTAPQRDLPPAPVPDDQLHRAPVVLESFAVKLNTLDSVKTYRVGQPITFVVSTDKECYLYLVDVGTDRRTHLLFPNKWNRSNKVAGGQSYRIPPEDGETRFVADVPEGTEYVKAVATLEPLKSIADKAPTGESPFSRITEPVTAWQRIEAELKGKALTSWSEAQMALQIVK